MSDPDQSVCHADGAAAPVRDRAETPMRERAGAARLMARILAIGLAFYALYWVVGVIQPQVYRPSFLLVALVLTFLLYPATPSRHARVSPLDWLLVLLTVVALAWPLVDLERFVYRAATPSPADLSLGSLTTVLVLEGTRRTVGWILPLTATAFIAYAHFGHVLDLVGLEAIGHRGYPLDRLVGTLFMTLEGLFGVPLDVAATYIVLFTIYGAVLEHSGAGRFFLDWSMAAMGRSGHGAGPARTVTVAGFMLGTVSGSGVATTVTLGAVAWPLLRRAGYPADVGGAILSAAGIGAILSPPTLGAAAFLIAEFLNISYLRVLAMASIPTMLYYVSIFLMIEADSRRMGMRGVAMETPSIGRLTMRSGYHFSSLVVIAILMVAGMTAFKAVFWATLLAVGLSFLDSATALYPTRLLRALEAGARGGPSIAATTATAGIIVGVVTLTGLGLKIAGLIVAVAGGSLLLTVLLAALAVWVLGLAVPVTASYIIAAVMIAPALTQVGVSDLAAHMFIFYYAVLSEVSPPTALSPFAAAALTGGNPFRTMMLTWKYTVPAFLVPLVFTLSPEGMGLLLQAPLAHVLLTTLSATAGVRAVAVSLGGWLRRAATIGERALAAVSGLLLFHAGATTDAVGLGLLLLLATTHLFRIRPGQGASRRS